MIEEIDLRPLCRHSDKLRCTIYLRDPESYEEVPWIQLGRVDLRSRNESGVTQLVARMEATDIEHDSAYAIVLPLIGLSLNYIHGHTSVLHAWIEPEADDFRVPTPGYDPRTHSDTFKCDIEDHDHLIIPEKLYTPPFNRELFERVRGKKVKISIGPVWKEGEPQ